MAIDLGNFFGSAGNWLVSLTFTVGFWIAVCLVAAVVIWGGLVLRKRKMMDKPVLVLYDLSPTVYNKDGSVDWEKSLGIMDFETTKGGWFKEKFTLRGLIDYGTEKIFRLKDMTPVFDVSHNDYRKINGENGIVVVRNPSDPKFVVPISKFCLSKNAKNCMAEIAPVDLRNAATASIEQVDFEMKSLWEKWSPIIATIVLAFIFVFAILIISQMLKSNVETTSETLKYTADVLAGKSTAIVTPSAPNVP